MSNGAILFPGQGAQALGMGLDIEAEHSAARAVFDAAADVLGQDLRTIIGGDDKAALDRTDVCQPAILVTSLAVMAALGERDLIDEDAVGGVAGLSLGEYTALTWAGALALEDAIRLVRLRGEAMQRASDERPSGMLSLMGATPESAGELCEAARGGGVLVVANLLAKGQVAIAGTVDALDRAEAQMRDHGIRKGVRLPVAGAFHSPCMESAAADLAAAVDATAVTPPRKPVVMNVSGEPVDAPDTIRDLLKRQITSPVRWQASVERLVADGARPFFEPAPGKQLTNMVKRAKWPERVEPSVTTCATNDELAAMSVWPPRA